MAWFVIACVCAGRSAVADRFGSSAFPFSPGISTFPVRPAGYTVYSGLRWADPQPHERVAVLGIGGLGHLAVQYAKAAGFETIAISHSPDKDKMIRELGADEIVRDGKSLAAAGGADIILTTSNSTKSMADSIQGLRPDGRFIVMGADAEPLSISLIELLFKRIKIIGSQQNGPEYLYEALDYVAQGKVRIPDDGDRWFRAIVITIPG
jgi:alcohol dehydrogenase